MQAIGLGLFHSHRACSASRQHLVRARNITSELSNCKNDHSIIPASSLQQQHNSLTCSSSSSSSSSRPDSLSRKSIAANGSSGDDCCFAPGDGAAGGSNAGGGGGGGGGGGSDAGGSDDFQHRSPITEDSEEEQYPQVRSFCCLNVGPVVTHDEGEWRAFNEQEMHLREDFWRPCLLPCHVQADIMWELVSQPRMTEASLSWVKQQVEDWYRNQGYTMATVTGFSGLKSGLLCCRINEGIITQIKVRFRDGKGNDDAAGITSKDVIRRELSQAVKEGMPYNMRTAKAAMQRVFQLHLFDRVDVELKKNERLGGIALDFLVQERSQDGCYFQTGLSFYSTDSGRPVLASIRPAATLSVEHRNIAGMNRTLHGYIHSNDLLSPQDDSRFKLEYVHPYIDGLQDPRHRIFRVNCYNSRKLTAVYSRPFSQGQVPAIWVDRAGLKANITEKFSKESKLTYGFVVEEVATRDNIGPIQTIDPDMAPESGGIEHVPFFHIKITRDNTRLVKGSRVGAVDIFQVDQGVGFGSKASFFNKHQYSTTKFVPLPSSSSDSFPLMIVRARYGGILGDFPSCRAFTNGGPYALRGSNVGELGSCTSFVELMGEVRVPVQKHYAYGFVESLTELDGFLYHGQTLNSLVKNAGSGVSLGIGLKMGDIRTEYIFDCCTRTGSVNVQLGDRI